MSDYPIWKAGIDGSAERLARIAHQGQVDKIGRAYIHHPRTVAALTAEAAFQRGWSATRMDIAIDVAWLHDVLEDTRVTAEMMRVLGVPEVTLEHVETLTRRKGVSAEDYYDRIKGDPITLLVKEMDIHHNTDPLRMRVLDEATRQRLRAKYAKAREALGLAS